MKNDAYEVKQDVESTNNESKDYQVEGYATCGTALKRCQHDCAGSAFWTSAN